jgi:hypothetical protein
LSRQRIALFSYAALLAAVLADLVLIFVFPAYPVFLALLGPIFILLGFQIVYFFKEHAKIWENWGAPSPALFLFVGFSFTMIGILFTFGPVLL